MGNGFPVSALLTRREITEHFYRKGVEYFNTYGGNPVSCRAALSVMEVLEREKLIENAQQVGNYLLGRLKEIKEQYTIVGDIRGRGLFLGIELVVDRETRQPASDAARIIKYR